MYERRRARILLAILTLVSLVVLTIDERAGGDGVLARLRDGASTVFAPVQEGLTALVRPVAGVVDGAVELFRLRQDNAQLRAAIERERQRGRTLEDLARENERLRELLEMRDDLSAGSEEFAFLAADVTAVAPSNFEWTMSLDVGTRDGVAEGMPVLDGDGLVGRVVQVGPLSSRVLLTVDPNFGAAARIARTGEHGIVSGNDTEPLRLQLLDPEADVRPGDEVVTSSWSNAAFPADIPIGAVETVGETTGSLTREVTVRPFVDFTRLDVVLVLLRSPPPDPLPIPTPGGDEAPGVPTPDPSQFPGGTPTAPPSLDPNVEPTT